VGNHGGATTPERAATPAATPGRAGPPPPPRPAPRPAPGGARLYITPLIPLFAGGALAAGAALGVLDLIVAAGTGTGLLAPLVAPELGPRVPPAPAMGVLPMFLVPAFAVPMSLLLHVLALGRLLREIRFGARLAPSGAR
jgi:hypothetical protein